MLWVTRNHVHVDRVATPWLIKRFIDKKAQFIFLEREQINEFVEKTGATPYDTGTGVELDHHECDGEKHCTFDAVFEKYDLYNDAALEKVRQVVRAADTGGDNPYAYGMEVVATGSVLLRDVEDDHDALVKEFPFYDALYAYFKRGLIIEEYKAEYEALKTRGEKVAFVKEKLYAK